MYQRLKELDADTFEKLCFHLTCARFPEVDIRHVDGRAGDAGLDLFMGDLDAGPTVWQCKSFPNGVGKVQKKQVCASLKRALKHEPRRWFLCLSVDMGEPAHRWFQRLQKSYAHRLQIELIQGGDIVQELLYRDAIREQFFPGAIIDMHAFLEIVTKTGRLTIEELGALNDGNMAQYLKRLEDEDARFAYSVRYGRNIGPLDEQPRPGQVGSVSYGTRTIDIFVRDAKALRLHPATGQFTFVGTGVEKMEASLATGAPQVIGPGELAAYSTGFEFLIPPGEVDIQNATLFLGSVKGSLPSMIARATFGSGSDAIIYECLKLNATRFGREEAAFETGRDFPLRLSIVLTFPTGGSFNFETQWAGSEVRAIQKAIRALKALYIDGHFQLYDLERSGVMNARVQAEMPSWLPEYEALIGDIAGVSEFYGVALRMREDLTPEDCESLSLLKRLAESEVPMEASEITFELTKAVDTLTDAAAELVRGEASYLVTVGEYVPTPHLFGTPVPTGPVAFHIPRATVDNPEVAYRFLRTASIGESIKLRLKPLCPVQVRTIRRAAARDVLSDADVTLRSPS